MSVTPKMCVSCFLEEEITRGKRYVLERDVIEINKQLIPI